MRVHKRGFSFFQPKLRGPMSELVHLMVGPGQQAHNERFGTLMHSIRNEQGHSRAQAAHILDVSQEYIRLIELGERAPAAGMIQQILEKFGERVEVRSVGPPRVLIFHGHCVTFASRIQEARGGVKTSVKVNRYERIGQIISLLAIAEDEMVDAVYRKLK